MLRHFLDLFVASGVPQEQLTAAIKYIIIPIIQVPTCWLHAFETQA